VKVPRARKTRTPRRDDAVFKALADRHRRTILDRLFRRDGQTLGQMCEGAAMTRFGVMKHLRVLEAAGLIVARRRGREKLHYLNPMPIRLVHDRWVSKYRAPIAEALSALKSKLEGAMADTQIYEILIHTTPAKLWEALTHGEITKKYFFGETLVSDWKKGSAWHSINPNGSRDVEGTVLEVEAPRRLVVTWHVLYNPELKDEHSQVTFEIQQRGQVCKLTVVHELERAPKTAKHVANGWPVVLAGLKTLLETGRPMPMPEPLME
jgi:uncharacterized protein YndB with AHSA1/START domain/DNA-binding transcriptional ArsR family regulator